MPRPTSFGVATIAAALCAIFCLTRLVDAASGDCAALSAGVVPLAGGSHTVFRRCAASDVDITFLVDANATVVFDQVNIGGTASSMRFHPNPVGPTPSAIAGLKIFVADSTIRCASEAVVVGNSAHTVDGVTIAVARSTVEATSGRAAVIAAGAATNCVLAASDGATVRAGGTALAPKAVLALAPAHNATDVQILAVDATVEAIAAGATFGVAAMAIAAVNDHLEVTRFTARAIRSRVVAESGYGGSGIAALGVTAQSDQGAGSLAASELYFEAAEGSYVLARGDYDGEAIAAVGVAMKGYAYDVSITKSVFLVQGASHAVVTSAYQSDSMAVMGIAASYSPATVSDSVFVAIDAHLRAVFRDTGSEVIAILGAAIQPGSAPTLSLSNVSFWGSHVNVNNTCPTLDRGVTAVGLATLPGATIDAVNVSIAALSSAISSCGNPLDSVVQGTIGGVTTDSNTVIACCNATATGASVAAPCNNSLSAAQCLEAYPRPSSPLPDPAAWSVLLPQVPWSLTPTPSASTTRTATEGTPSASLTSSQTATKGTRSTSRTPSGSGTGNTPSPSGGTHTSTDSGNTPTVSYLTDTQTQSGATPSVTPVPSRTLTASASRSLPTPTQSGPTRSGSPTPSPTPTASRSTSPPSPTSTRPTASGTPSPGPTLSTTPSRTPSIGSPTHSGPGPTPSVSRTPGTPSSSATHTRSGTAPTPTASASDTIMPPQPVKVPEMLSERVVAAVTTTSAGMSLVSAGNPAVAAQAGRLGALRAALLCGGGEEELLQEPEPTANPTGLSVSPTGAIPDTDADRARAAHIGSVLANSAILVGCAILGVLIVPALRVATGAGASSGRTSCWQRLTTSGMASARAPALLSFPLAFFAQPMTMSAAIAVVPTTVASAGAGSATFGGFVLLLGLGPLSGILAIGAALYRRYFHNTFEATPCEVPEWNFARSLPSRRRGRNQRQPIDRDPEDEDDDDQSDGNNNGSLLGAGGRMGFRARVATETRRAAHWLLDPNAEWKERPPAGAVRAEASIAWTDPLAVGSGAVAADATVGDVRLRQFGMVFDAYGANAPWFFLAELVFGLVCGAIDGVQAVIPGACEYTVWAMAACFLAFTVVLLVLKPYARRIDQLSQVIVTSLQFVVLLLAAVETTIAAPQPSENDPNTPRLKSAKLQEAAAGLADVVAYAVVVVSVLEVAKGLQRQLRHTLERRKREREQRQREHQRRLDQQSQALTDAMAPLVDVEVDPTAAAAEPSTPDTVARNVPARPGTAPRTARRLDPNRAMDWMDSLVPAGQHNPGSAGAGADDGVASVYTDTSDAEADDDDDDDGTYATAFGGTADRLPLGSMLLAVPLGASTTSNSGWYRPPDHRRSSAIPVATDDAAAPTPLSPRRLPSMLLQRRSRPVSPPGARRPSVVAFDDDAGTFDFHGIVSVDVIDVDGPAVPFPGGGGDGSNGTGDFDDVEDLEGRIARSRRPSREHPVQRESNSPPEPPGGANPARNTSRGSHNGGSSASSECRAPLGSASVQPSIAATPGAQTPAARAAADDRYILDLLLEGMPPPTPAVVRSAFGERSADVGDFI